MQRGEIYEVDFEPVRGAEANKMRPAVIVSNDAANATVERLQRGVISVVPLTTNVSKVLSFQVLLPKARTRLEKASKAQAEQVRSVAIERVGRRLGAVPRDLMTRIDDALRLHLSL